MGGSHRADVAVCRPAGRTSLLALTVALVAAAVCLFARPAAAKPFDLGGRDWEGCADFVQLARTELGARAVPTSRVELGELTPEDALVLLHPDQPLDVASLGAFLRSGGRVILLDDFGHGDELLQYFSIQRVPLPSRPAEVLRHNAELPIAEPASHHVLTNGVGRVVLNHATGLANAELSPVLSVRGQGEPDVVVALAGLVLKGRLLAVGDASFVMNSMLRYPGNKLFAKNILGYAANADAPSATPGKVYILSGTFDLHGKVGESTSGGSDLMRNVNEALAGIAREGMPPFLAYFLSVVLGLGLVMWTGSRAGKVHAATTPRYTRVIPLAAQGGVAGHASVVGGARASRALALLELKSALEEELTILLGLERVPAADVLVAHVTGSHLLDAKAGHALRQLLLRMAKIETMILSPQTHALRKIRDREVLVTAAVVNRILAAARKNARNVKGRPA